MAAGPGAGPDPAGRCTAEVEVQQSAVEVVHDPAKQRVAGIEIRPQDPQPAVDDDGNGNQDERGEGEASCETLHWGIMARARCMCCRQGAGVGAARMVLWALRRR
jgi:hypothetical protein